MFEVEIDGKTYKAKVTFYTAQLYEMEFRSDLIQDLFGIQTAEQAIEVEVDGDGEDSTARIAKIDFTKISWTSVMKVLWAALKTADDTIPNYSEWMRTTSGMNLWTVQELIGDEVSDCYFRSSIAEEEESQG